MKKFRRYKVFTIAFVVILGLLLSSLAASFATSPTVEGAVNVVNGNGIYPILQAAITSPQNGTSFPVNTDFDVVVTVTNVPVLPAGILVAPIAVGGGACNVGTSMQITGPTTGPLVSGPVTITGGPTPQVIPQLPNGQSGTFTYTLRGNVPGNVTITVSPYGYVCAVTDSNQILLCSLGGSADSSMVAGNSQGPLPIPADHLISSTIEVSITGSGSGSSSSGGSNQGPGTGSQGSDIFVVGLNANPQQAVANQEVNIFGNIANRGDVEGNYELTLKINGKIEATRSGQISANKATPVKFTVYREEPGTYQVDLNGQRTFFTIVGPTKNNPLDARMIFIIILSVLVLTAVIVLIKHFATR